MHDDLYDGLKEEIEEGVNILLERKWQPYNILTEALVEGMRIVGIDFRDGILFVPEVLQSANAMKAGMAILRPLLAETGAPRVGKMVIGTVKGDIHDIGKNLVSMMMEGAGFEVVDIGIDNPVENYLAAIEEHEPDILGMSALLTTTMPYMKVVIETLKEQGIRDDYTVLVGGAPLNEEFAQAVGADAYCSDAAVCGGNRQGLHEAQAQPAWRHDDQLTHGGCAGASPDRTNRQERPAPRHSGPVRCRHGVRAGCWTCRRTARLSSPGAAEPAPWSSACGALAREIVHFRDMNEVPAFDVACLPPPGSTMRRN